jgi:SAM-dependent methyltransferase
LATFTNFDRRGYRTVSPRDGYALWSTTYEATIKPDMDRWLLEALTSVAWDRVERAADLGCGTGRTGAWLRDRGVGRVDGVDVTPEMLERARERGVFAELHLADVRDSGLGAASYDLVTTCLVDEHLASLGPLYRESARLVRPGGAHVIVGFHPFFVMRSGMPTHFDGPGGEPLAIETHVHLFSDHVQAALAAGWRLAEAREQVIDERWVAQKPSWAAHRDVPISYAFVWRRDPG